MQGVLKKLLNPSGTPSTLSRLCIEVYVINRNKAFAKRQMGIRFIAVTSQTVKKKTLKEAFIFTFLWALSSAAILEIRHGISPNDIKGPSHSCLQEMV